MKLKRKAALCLLLAAVMTAACGFGAQAASRKKIKTVSVTVESNILPGMAHGEEEIEVEVSGSRYYYDYYDIENASFEWEEEDIPKISIYLRAESGYYFSLTKASSVKLTGATYVTATKQDSSETLKLTVTLPSLDESIAELTEVTLTKNGYAMWDAVTGAGSYEVRLYRNDSGIGATIPSTTETWYDFTGSMTKSGSYYAKVRPVNAVNTEKKGEWVLSNEVTISEEQAKLIQSGEAGGMPQRGEWMSDETGWKYVYTDGTWPAGEWLELDDAWYYFGDDGYMQTGWIEWEGKYYYCDETTGAMLTNTTTPDGYLLGSDGTIRTD